MRGLLIQVNGDHEFREITGYADIREAVGGNFDWTAPGIANYYCYEYALYERPVNAVATALYWATHGEQAPLSGPVLVLGPVDGEDETDVPEEIVQSAQKIRDELAADGTLDDPKLLPQPAQDKIRIQMMDAQLEASQALIQGQGVDFGGIQIGPASDDGLAPDDGNRRMGGSRELP